MVRQRWLWVGLIALAVLLVPAVLWTERQPPAPDPGQASAPPMPAADGSDLQPDDDGPEAKLAESQLYMLAGHTAAVAVVDGNSGDVMQTLERAILAPDASRLYEVRQTAGQTVVRAVETKTGRTAGEIGLAGEYDLPWIGFLPAGLSPSGRWLVLQRLSWWEEDNQGVWNDSASSHFAVVDLSFDAPARMVDLEGYLEFDALSDDGTRLYLTEYLREDVGTEPVFERYRVRLYDLASGRLDPAIIADKSNAEELMAGYRQSAAASPDGRWLYSLYLDPRSGSPFVHALNLAEGFAACIDLPGAAARREVEPMLWGLAVAPGGETLYVINGAGGLAFEIDTAGLVVRRSVELEAPQAGDRAPGRLGRLLTLLQAQVATHVAPAAHAKVGVVNPVVLSPDGDTLYALAATGLLAVDTGALNVRGQYLTDHKLNSLAMSGDGAALYAVSLEPGRIMRLAPETGEILATVESKDYWPGILAVAGTPQLAAADAGRPALATCEVTLAQKPPFVPPAPYDALAPEAGSFWYGSPDLWTVLPTAGTWRQLPLGSGGYTQKTFWWRMGYDSQKEPVPDLVVTGRRLDGPAPALVASRATNGYQVDMGSFMLAGIEVPAAGCWQITGRAGDQELSYVVWVAP